MCIRDSYGLIRAQRKTMALKVSEDGTVTVRIPYGVRPEEADRFVEAHVDWIRKRIAECRERAAARPAYTDREREADVYKRQVENRKLRHDMDRGKLVQGEIILEQ